MEVSFLKRKIVVENTLTPYIDYLESQGYDVYTLYRNDNLQNIVSNEYDAIVVSGLDQLSLNDTEFEKPNASIIEADGLTPEEVHSIIQDKANLGS